MSRIGKPLESTNTKIILLMVLIVAAIGWFVIWPIWKSVSGTWHNVAGMNKGELEWVRGPDGKGMIRPVDREKDRQERIDDYERQQKYQRQLENERYRQGYVPGRFRP
jgi:hypothetical protein